MRKEVGERTVQSLEENIPDKRQQASSAKAPDEEHGWCVMAGTE